MIPAKMLYLQQNQMKNRKTWDSPKSPSTKLLQSIKVATTRLPPNSQMSKALINLVFQKIVHNLNFTILVVFKNCLKCAKNRQNFIQDCSLWNPLSISHICFFISRSLLQLYPSPFFGGSLGKAYHISGIVLLYESVLFLFNRLSIV